MEQEIVKPKFYYCVPVAVSKIVLERDGKNNELLRRLRMETDLGNITYKPKKRTIEQNNLLGFETESSKVESFLVSEFLIENPMLKELNDSANKKPQEIILSYAEISNIDKETNEEKFYKYLVEKQFKSLYWENYHKDTKETLDIQKKNKETYESKESKP